MHESHELRRVLDLEPMGDDTFRGPAMDSDVFVRTFGGHTAAQAIAAATATIEDDKRVHSLHSYFLRPCKADEDTTYTVTRLKDGRSFSTRRVEAWQDEALCYSMIASFHHANDAGPEHAEPMPDVPAPETLEIPKTIPSGVTGAERDYREWDIRIAADGPTPDAASTVSGRSIWFRYKYELPDEDAFHACALVYMSDMTLLFSALAAHPEYEAQLASLDHTVWFFRPVRVNEWLLYHQSSPSATSGRSLVQGRLFDASGNLVALVAQEGLTRELQVGQTQVPVRRS